MTEQLDTVTLVPNAGWDPRILVCRCGTLVDTTIVVAERYVVLVDTMHNARMAGALLEIARPHLESRQLLVVNTHADWDHAWGNQLFVGDGAAHPAPVIGSRRCAERLRSAEARRKLEAMRAAQPGRFDDVRLVPPTITFDGALAIDGGDLTLELFATPGHQPDHIAVWIPQIRTLLAGDAAESPFPFVDSAATLPQLRDSLARMAALEPAAALYCHAPADAGPALLQANIAYFDEVERRCRLALADGPIALADDSDVEALAGFSFADAIPAGADARELAGFYRPAHHRALRATLEHLSAHI
jgi:glyoxylase-like metal-dependent hydrolase (beta-lactamase superfamily II)